MLLTVPKMFPTVPLWVPWGTIVGTVGNKKVPWVTTVGNISLMFPTVLGVPWGTVPWGTGNIKYRGEQESTVGDIKVPWVTLVVPWGTEKYRGG